MNYYKNVEIAKLYNVSRSAVGKWVEAARKGKLDLQMVDESGKSYIAATSKNLAIIEAMVRDRKKYFNKLSHKIIKPKPEFYELFAPEQILDIISNLEISGEIPRQYNYFGKGADIWDEYIQRRLAEGDKKSATFAAPLQLAMNRSYLDNVLGKYERINIIDVGPGNALPVKGLLTQLLSRGKLGRYLAIDISPEMLVVAQRNIKKWFGNRVAFEADVRDITHERFADQLARTSLSSPSEEVNLILFLGGTLGNLFWPDEALRVFYHSIGLNDFFVYNLKLDNDKSRQTFDFAAKPSEDFRKSHFAFDLLDFDESCYEAETGYDPERGERFARVRINVALSIVFDLPGGQKQVDFEKDETIMLWRYKHQTADNVMDQFKANGFDILQASMTEDREFLMLICSVAAHG